MLNRTENKNRVGVQPYSLPIKTVRNEATGEYRIGADEYFGFAPHTLHQWIYDGKLVQGKHYLKIGRKTVILTHGFIEYMEECNVGKKAGR